MGIGYLNSNTVLCYTSLTNTWSSTPKSTHYTIFESEMPFMSDAKTIEFDILLSVGPI